MSLWNRVRPEVDGSRSIGGRYAGESTRWGPPMGAGRSSGGGYAEEKNRWSLPNVSTTGGVGTGFGLTTRGGTGDAKTSGVRHSKELEKTLDILANMSDETSKVALEIINTVIVNESSDQIKGSGPPQGLRQQGQMGDVQDFAHERRFSPLRQQRYSPHRSTSLFREKRHYSPYPSIRPLRKYPNSPHRSISPLRKSNYRPHRSISPLQKSHYRPHRSISPLQKSHYRTHRSISPLRKSHYSQHRSISPIQKSHYSTHRSISPLRQSHYSPHRSISPLRDSRYSPHRSISPIRGSRYSLRHLSPRDEFHYSSYRSTGPFRERHYSSYRSLSPLQKRHSSRKRSISPLVEDRYSSIERHFNSNHGHPNSPHRSISPSHEHHFSSYEGHSSPNHEHPNSPPPAKIQSVFERLSHSKKKHGVLGARDLRVTKLNKTQSGPRPSIANTVPPQRANPATMKADSTFHHMDQMNAAPGMMPDIETLFVTKIEILMDNGTHVIKSEKHMSRILAQQTKENLRILIKVAPHPPGKFALKYKIAPLLQDGIWTPAGKDYIVTWKP